MRATFGVPARPTAIAALPALVPRTAVAKIAVKIGGKASTPSRQRRATDCKRGPRLVIVAPTRTPPRPAIAAADRLRTSDSRPADKVRASTSRPSRSVPSQWWDDAPMSASFVLSC